MIIDFIPGPVYRFGCWIKERPKYIKWWLQRANHKVPDCDCWEFNDSLASYIVQGLDFLLDKGVRDWTQSQEEYKDLDFARKALREFIDLHSKPLSMDKETADYLNKKFGEGSTYYISKEDFDKHEKDLQKAMAYIGKYLWGLWD